MAKKAKMIKSPDGNKLAIVNPDAAGIDIADTESKYAFQKTEMEITTVDSAASPVNLIRLLNGCKTVILLL